VADVRHRPIVIAHRGASGYLPEHTLAAKALAVGMGADFLEQDVVATRDGHLIVFHDLTLEQTTDVCTCFPGRARADGRYYCIDFDLAELRMLRVGERIGPDGRALYANRFPAGAGPFAIPTLEEELAFVRGLERSTGRQIGIYPEIKEPAWHRAAGIELGDQVLALLDRFGYRGPDDPAFVQCFDERELIRLRTVRGSRLRLVQLIGSGPTAPGPAELARIAGYADAIGPSLRLLWAAGIDSGAQQLVDAARRAGLGVHPYTLRRDDLPPGCPDFETLLTAVFLRLGADGAFTDFPDLAARFIERHFPA
jgi:glycerophosphoryl diester phosphodiesterase